MKCLLPLLLLLLGCSPPKALHLYGSVPAFTFTSQAGQAMHSQELAGRVWIADFVFTQCGGLCPLMTARMRRLQDTLPGEIRLISFSVDPANDTPEVLARYARQNGADTQRWSFLTGDKSALYALSKEGFKLPVDDTGGTEIEPIGHSSRFALVDQQGRIRGYYNMDDEPDSFDQLVRDARSLL